MDFILNFPDQIIPIDVKFTEIKKPKITRSFRSFLQSYALERGVVCTKNLWNRIKLKNSNVLFVPVVYV